MKKNPSGNLLSSKTPSQDLEDRYVLDGLRIVKIIYHTCTFSRKSGLMRQNWTILPKESVNRQLAANQTIVLSLLMLTLLSVVQFSKF